MTPVNPKILGALNEMGLALDNHPQALQSLSALHQNTGQLAAQLSAVQPVAIKGVGKVYQVPVPVLQALVNQNLALSVYGMNLTEQTMFLEKESGQTAPLDVREQDFLGLELPEGLENLSFDLEDSTLYAHLQAPSSLAPNIMIPVKKALIKAGEAKEGLVYTKEALLSLVQKFQEVKKGVIAPESPVSTE